MEFFVDNFFVKNLFGLGINIAWYAIIICCGIIAGIIVGRYNAKIRGYNVDLIIDFVILAVPLALIGARVYFVIMEWNSYAGNFLEMIAIWHGGLAIYGGVIGGLIAVLIFCKWRKFSIGEMVDIAAPALVLGQSIGRWGNFVNQEAFGAPVTNPAMQWFPFAVNITHDHYTDAYGAVKTLCEYPWHYATFFYESIWNLLVFIVLMFYQKKSKRRGNVFVMYLVLYGAGRFFIEGVRTDSLYIFGTIRVSQAVALLCVILGLAYLLITRKREQKPFEYIGKIYDLGYKKETKKKETQKEENDGAEEDSPAIDAEKAEEKTCPACDEKNITAEEDEN